MAYSGRSGVVPSVSQQLLNLDVSQDYRIEFWVIYARFSGGDATTCNLVASIGDVTIFADPITQKIFSDANTQGSQSSRAPSPSSIWRRRSGTFRPAQASGLFTFKMVCSSTSTTSYATQVNIDDISISLASTAATPIAPSGVNLLTNPSLESGLAPWYATSNAVLTSSVGAHTGSYVA